ncbi:hypothetical protein OG806_05860 [Streptomyces sp. NBC_00882]|nr:hypothetical protein OG806_05860 [Streptomyces sp. NBC_00882]WSZ56013.1 hypothetical protein OH824_05435 [Streptomyces canus]
MATPPVRTFISGLALTSPALGLAAIDPRRLRCRYRGLDRP